MAGYHRCCGASPVTGEGHDAVASGPDAHTLVLVSISRPPVPSRKQSFWLAQLRQDAWATIPTVARDAGPAIGDDTSSGFLDFMDGGVQPVHDVDIAVGIHLQRVQVIRCRSVAGPPSPL